MGDDPVIIWLYPAVGLACFSAVRDYGVFGPLFHQDPIVFIDRGRVGEGYRHRINCRFLQSGSVELQFIANCTDVGPGALAFGYGILACRGRDVRSIRRSCGGGSFRGWSSRFCGATIRAKIAMRTEPEIEARTRTSKYVLAVREKS